MKRKFVNFEENLKRIGLNALTEDSEVIVEDVTTEEGEDDLDSEYVSESMLNRIKNLPMEKMEESDVEDFLKRLENKKFKDNASDSLKKLAEETVDMLFEVKAERTRRSKALSMGKKKSFQCPQGFRQDSSGGGAPRCVPSRRAAGGAGKLAKQKREKAKWARSGKGSMSQRKSAKWAARRESGTEVEEMSIIAKELRSLVEDTSPVMESVSERDELIGRLVNIVEMLSEEYADKDVTDFFNEHLDNLLDSYKIGRLDEGVMNEDEFIATLSPVLNLIKESYRKLDSGEDLGN